MSGDSSFKRWDWVSFKYREPTRDKRVESCHVFEDSFVIDGTMRKSERASVLDPLTKRSVGAAHDAGHSLALIRPRNTKFTAKPKKNSQIELEREAFRHAAAQTSLLDEKLATIDPTPFEFRFRFEDDDGVHNFQNGDWEAHAMYRKRISDGWTQTETLDWMYQVFNVDYPEQGMLFAVGNMASRPHTWQLLGVLRVDEPAQRPLF